MSITKHPEGLKNKTIQAIGSVYLAEHVSWSLFHHSHDVAIALNKYNFDGTSEEKWKFLADEFEKLPSIKGEIAEKILNLFRKAFDEYIPLDKLHKEKVLFVEHFCIKKLDNKEVANYLRKLSSHYYDRKYHKNHLMREEVKNCCSPGVR